MKTVRPRRVRLRGGLARLRARTRRVVQRVQDRVAVVLRDARVRKPSVQAQLFFSDQIRTHVQLVSFEKRFVVDGSHLQITSVHNCGWTELGAGRPRGLQRSVCHADSTFQTVRYVDSTILRHSLLERIQ